MFKRIGIISILLLLLPGVGALPAAAQNAGDEGLYDDHAQRDPFWPLVTSGGAIVTYDTNFAVAEMVLEGVILDGKGGIAIINGTVVEQGSNLGSYLVQKVEADKVILVKDGQSSVLRLKKEE